MGGGFGAVKLNTESDKNISNDLSAKDFAKAASSINQYTPDKARIEASESKEQDGEDEDDEDEDYEDDDYEEDN